MNVDQLAESLRSDPMFMQNVVRWDVLPARPAVYEPFPDSLDPRLLPVLEKRGVHQLYRHQAHAIREVLAGRDVVVVTPTASGKTMCYNLPVLSAILQNDDARALYLFPTKALSADQVSELYELIEAMGVDIKTYTYDGDTPGAARKAVRQAGHIVVTNPDMLHSGILPSNEGRGYVLRRLLRRAARHGRMLGIDHPFLVDLVETVIQSSESAYPELREHDAYIKKVIGTEEANFARTIDAGMNILNNMIDGLEKAHQHLLKGLDVFKLNDTFGFPLDLTKEIAAEQGIEIDEDGFHAEMKKQKERARAERLKKNISGWSEDLFGGLTVEPTVFTGYETLNDTGVVVALSDEETLTDAIATDEEAKDGVLVVLDKTPFYAEMGGQVADNGLLTGPECSLRVLDVKKTPKGYYVHTCVLESGIVKVGDHLNAQVDKEYRMSVCRNHTATHLLQAALREVLGDHVHQAGSYQDAEITHFDFTHFSAVTPEELARVQKIVNDKIYESMNVTVKEMPIEEAKKLGAMALFGEKYGKVVRVVDIEGWSTEFCGGTHVKNTAQIGGFKIVSESSVAAGIRRIEAVTGRNLLVRANLQEAMLHTVANTLKANNITSLPIRAEAVMAENKAMSKELEEIKAKVAASKVSSLFDNAEEVSGVKIASAYFTGTTGETLRGMCDSIRDKAVNPVVAVLVGKAEDKVTMAVTVNKLAQEKGLKAGVLVKEISAIAGGKGGGKPDFAMAGLKDETKIDEALAAVKGIVEKQLG